MLHSCPLIAMQASIVESIHPALPRTVLRDASQIALLNAALAAAVPGSTVRVVGTDAVVTSQRQQQEFAMSVLRRFLAEHTAQQLQPSPPKYWAILPTPGPRLVDLDLTTDLEEYQFVVSKFHQPDFVKPIVLIQRVQVSADPMELISFETFGCTGCCNR